ncbi:MAG: acyl-ACP--UDP-N-acetylglucosamine O-acyltransferase [Paracoccaceae bacterium]|jgi:UDP-N-acetylglucosamine acyltransferase|nr:acyl-ACP--UDP-N-acetylglucosamine O-acyltransferase [Paracoccaceae bacterium]
MGVAQSAIVHPTALVEDGAEIGEGAHVGPFCVVGPEVRLGARVTLKSHVVVTGDTRIGDETVVFPFAVLGEIPQDLKFGGERTRLEIGARNRIREHVTIHTGTGGGGGLTRVGDDCLIMAGAHVAHDCRVGDGVILVNNAGIAGHVTIEDEVIVGGLSGVHQWVRIGRGAMIGAVTFVAHDVMPYGLVHGERGRLDGLNLVGLKRKGRSREEIAALRAAFAALSGGEGAFQERARALDTDSALVREVVDFVTAASGRSFLTPQRGEA